MSYDMFVQRFENGKSPAISADAFDSVFGAYLDRFEDGHDFFHICTPDGGEADLYPGPAGHSPNSLMISRFSAGQVLDLLVEFARRADAVILPPGRPTLIVREDQRRHLPEECAGQVVVVGSGADIVNVLAAR